MSIKQFWIRLSIYVVFGIAVPFTYLSIRFKLFQKINMIQIGGWGIVAIVMAAVFFIKLAKAVKKGLPFGYYTQLINGFMYKLVPLAAILLILFLMKDHVKELIEFIIVLIPCQVISIAVNPIPVWAHENMLTEQGVNLKKVLNAAGIGKKEKQE